MLRNRRFLAVLLLGATTVIGGFLASLASNMLSVGWLLFILLLAGAGITSFGFFVWQSHIEQQDISPTKLDTPSKQGQQPLDTNKERDASATSASTFRKPDSTLTRSHPIPPPTSNLTDQALAPLHFDDSDIHEVHVINEPLPEKPQRVSEVSSAEKIASLPFLKAKLRFSKKLPEKPTMVYWSPDCASLACTFYEHGPVLLRGGDIVDLPAWDTLQAMCWSPDSRVLAMCMQGEIHLWDTINCSEWAPPLRVSARPVYGLDWSARGQLAVWVESQIQLFTPPDFTVLQSLPMQSMLRDNVSLLRWSQDGLLLAAGATSGSKPLICWHVMGTPTHQLLSSGLHPLSLTWFPRSSLLAVAFNNKQMMIWDAGKNQPLKTWEKLPVVPRTLSISLEQRLAVASIGKDLLFGRLNEPFPSSRYPGHWLAIWSPTHSKLATLDPQKETILNILEPVPSAPCTTS